MDVFVPSHYQCGQNPRSFRRLPVTNSSSIATKTNIFFSSTAKTKPLDHALKLFPLLPTRDTVTWNTAISASLLHRRPSTALRLFLHMLLSSSSLPDSITLRAVLRACSQTNNTHLPLQIHAYFFKLQPSFTSSELTILSTCFLNLYCEFEFTDLAHQLFVGIPNRDVVAFASMLKGFAEAGEYDEALVIFRDMVESDCLVMNQHVYSCALHACAGVLDLPTGRQIHACVIKGVMGSDVFVGTALVDLYAKCDDMGSARKAFSEISQPNLVSWNALLNGNLGRREGLQLLSEMRLSGVTPDHVTFAVVLRGCKDFASCYLVRELHGLIAKMMEVECDVFLSCALFEAYIELGCFCEARKVFRRMKEKDDVAFNLVIQGYLRSGNRVEALELFIEALAMGKEMREVTVTSLLMKLGGLDQGKQLHALLMKFGCCNTSSIAISLIRMYSEHHSLDEAIQLFEGIPSPDLILWTDLMSNFSRIGESQGALKLYVKMVTEGVTEPPNHYTFSTLLSSCAHLAAAEEGKQIHAQIVKSNSNIESDPFVASALLCMYSKCGYIQEARRIFKEMPERDLAAWNAMISSLAQHGFAKEAIETFQELLKQKDLEPNHITFVGILNACSHCGMVEMGYQYFKSIRKPTIDHYACLIGLYGRAGRLKEALDLVDEMPFEANEIIWSSLLASSSTYGNVEVGEYSARRLLELDPKDPGAYIVLSNIYAAAGRWEDVKHIRKLMKSQSKSKSPGLSWLRVNGEEYVFFADGRRSCISK